VHTLPRAIRALRQSPLKAVLVVAGAVLIIAGTTVAANTTLFADATSFKPQAYTELYFTDPHDLPKTMKADTVYDTSFTITNHSETAHTYRYIVTVQTESSIAVQPPASIRVAAGATATQRIHLKTPVPDQTTLVTVALEGTDQVIRFYALP